MKRLLFFGAVTASAIIASPASAQYHAPPAQNYGNPYTSSQSSGNNLTMRISQLQARLNEGVRVGSITRREARPIRRQINQVSALERQYGVNGFTGQERAAIQQRIRSARQALRQADDGAQGRYAEWDREDGYAWNGQNANHNWNNQQGRIDANRDGWDDRDHNRNGRWDDDVNYGYQHQQQQQAQPTGIAGIINSLLGAGGLQVGQRVPNGLYGVPYQHQAHYRDGNGVYYRSDGRHIYQIDARTHTVARVFPI